MAERVRLEHTIASQAPPASPPDVEMKIETESADSSRLCFCVFCRSFETTAVVVPTARKRDKKKGKKRRKEERKRKKERKKERKEMKK